jgi:transcriptional regulator with XRE-family HTH domain
MTVVQSETGWVPSTESFGARLALVRNHLGLNVAKAAELAGEDDSNWQNWERGVKPRDMVDKARKISEALGCNFLWLLTGSTEGSNATAGYPWAYDSLSDPAVAGALLDVTGLVPAA